MNVMEAANSQFDDQSPDTNEQWPSFGPATIIHNAFNEHWDTTRTEILKALSQPQFSASPRHLRIRSGQVLRASGNARSFIYGPHQKDDGRKLKSHTEYSSTGVDQDNESALQSALKISKEIMENKTYLLGQEAFTFSNLSQVDLLALAKLPKVAPYVLAFGKFDTSDTLLTHLLWDSLIPIAMVSYGRILHSLECAPEAFRVGDRWRMGNPYESDAGVTRFHETLGLIIVDLHAVDWPIPPSLPEGSPPKRTESPVGIVMSHATRSQNRRISPLDDPEKDAKISRSFAFFEVPNPNVVEKKVIDYLLNPIQKEQKWLHFADHGYQLRGQTSLVVASMLSSVFFENFSAIEIRATADSALQFTVATLLPGTKTYLPLTASWVYRNTPNSDEVSQLVDPGIHKGNQSIGLRLSTAYPGFGHSEYSSVMRTGFSDDTYDWAGLSAYIEVKVASLLSQNFVSNVYSAVGCLVIPRLKGRQESFFKWVLSQNEKSSYQRKDFGGQVTNYAPTTSTEARSEFELSIALRLTQIALGIAGIRSYVNIHLF